MNDPLWPQMRTLLDDLEASTSMHFGLVFRNMYLENAPKFYSLMLGPFPDIMAQMHPMHKDAIRVFTVKARHLIDEMLNAP